MLLLLLAGAGAGCLVAAGRARQQWRSLEAKLKDVTIWGGAEQATDRL